MDNERNWGGKIMNVANLRKSLAIAKVVGLSLVLSACAGVHLHNEKNAEIANTAEESFKKITAEIDADFEKVTKNQQAILDEELASVAKFTENDRDAALVIVAVSNEKLSKVWMEGMFKKRLKEIGVKGENLGGYAKKIEEMSKLRKKTLHFDASLKQRQDSLRFLGYTGDLICTAEEADPPINDKLVTKLLDAQPKEDRAEFKTALTDTYKEFKKKCANWRNGGLDKYFDTGEFKTALNKLKEARADEREAKDSVDEVKVAFHDAAQELEKRTPKEPDKKPSEIIRKQIEQLHSIVKGASSLLATLSAESKIVKERLSAVEQVLAFVAKGGKKEGDKESDQVESESETASNTGEQENQPELKGSRKRVALVLAGLPNLADGFSDLNRTLNRPPLTALIMAKGELQARLMAIQAELTREKAKIALINEQYDALVDELSAYNMVFTLINTADKAGGSVTDSTYKALMASVNSEKQRSAKAAIALQIQAESRSLRRRYQAEYRMIALDYQATKTLSRARVAQWNAMLGPLISQQKAYHESGIKRQDIASLAVELLKALGLFAIASEAN